MKKNVLMLSFLALMGAATFTSCKKDKPEDNEGELITTLKLTFTEQGTTDGLTFFYRDPDGEGGEEPTTHDEIKLKPGKQYNCVLSFLNESVVPTEDMTQEIAAEGHDHQIYFEPDPTSLVTVTNLNIDANGLPVGLTSTWTTAGADANGKIRISLKHKPGQKAAGDPVSKGETDVELDFVLKIVTP